MQYQYLSGDDSAVLGWPWSSMIQYYLTMVDYGYFLDDHGQELVGHGQPWSILFDNGQSW